MGWVRTNLAMLCKLVPEEGVFLTALPSARHFGDLDLDRAALRCRLGGEFPGVGFETAVEGLQGFTALFHILHDSGDPVANSAVMGYVAKHALRVPNQLAVLPPNRETHVRIRFDAIQFLSG